MLKLLTDIRPGLYTLNQNKKNNATGFLYTAMPRPDLLYIGARRNCLFADVASTLTKLLVLFQSRSSLRLDQCMVPTTHREYLIHFCVFGLPVIQEQPGASAETSISNTASSGNIWQIGHDSTACRGDTTSSAYLVCGTTKL